MRHRSVEPFAKCGRLRANGTSCEERRALQFLQPLLKPTPIRGLVNRLYRSAERWAQCAEVPPEVARYPCRVETPGRIGAQFRHAPRFHRGSSARRGSVDSKSEL